MAVMTYGNAHTAPVAVPPPPQPVARASNTPSAAFVGVAALASAFGGFVTYSHDPAILPTAIAASVTFFGALIALHVLHLAFRVTYALGKVAIPVAAILFIGCVLDWQWAETAVDWTQAILSRGVDAAARGWVGWQSQ